MIRLNSFNRLRCGFVVFCSAMLLVMTGCNRAFMNDEPEDPKPTPPAAPVYMSTSVAVRATQSDLASNSLKSEDEVAQLRILAFNSATGKLALNKFFGDTERDQFSNQVENEMATWKGAFPIEPDTYDFFFIANEDSWPSVKAKLVALSVGSSTMADLYKEDFAARIPYAGTNEAEHKKNRTFFPTEAGVAGHLILATRTYKNVLVQPIRNGKGASAADPQHFLAEGDEKIELIRTLAKVKVHIPNSATAEPDGTGKYKIKQFLPSRINKITLKNELPYQSLFLNPFLDSRVFPYLGTGGAPVKYSKDWYSATTDAARDYVLYDRGLVTNANETGLSVGVGADVIVPIGATYDPARRYDCEIWFYVPEHLRQAQTTDPAAAGLVNGATGLHFEMVGASGGKEFSIWQSDFTEGQQAVLDKGGVKKYYVLPNASDYSKHSVVRNNVYNITVAYGDGPAELRLRYEVLPWGNGGVSSLYANEAFNVYTADPAFKNAQTDIILSTATQYYPAGEYIELKAKSGFEFVLEGGASASTVKYGSIAAEQTFRNYRKIQLKATTVPTVLGTDVFDVCNKNGKVLYTVKAAEK